MGVEIQYNLVAIHRYVSIIFTLWLIKVRNNVLSILLESTSYMENHLSRARSNLFEILCFVLQSSSVSFVLRSYSNKSKLEPIVGNIKNIPVLRNSTLYKILFFRFCPEHNNGKLGSRIQTRYGAES